MTDLARHHLDPESYGPPRAGAFVIPGYVLGMRFLAGWRPVRWRWWGWWR